MNVYQKALASLSWASHNPINNSDPSRPPSSSSGMASASAGVAPSTAGRGTSTASATNGNTLDPASPDFIPVTALASTTATTTSSSSLFSSPDLVPLVMFLQKDHDALQQELKEKDDEIKDLKQKIKKWEEKWAAVRAIFLE